MFVRKSKYEELKGQLENIHAICRRQELVNDQYHYAFNKIKNERHRLQQEIPNLYDRHTGRNCYNIQPNPLLEEVLDFCSDMELFYHDKYKGELVTEVEHFMKKVVDGTELKEMEMLLNEKENEIYKLRKQLRELQEENKILYETALN